MNPKPTTLTLTLSPSPSTTAHIEVFPDGQRVQHGRKVTDTLRINCRELTKPASESLVVVVRRVLSVFPVVKVQTDEGMKAWVRENRKEL